jgi:hypothetical protein
VRETGPKRQRGLLSIARLSFGLQCVGLFASATVACAADGSVVPDYQHGAYALFEKYCISCHNSDDREGQLDLESFESLQHGGKNGPVLVSGNSQKSRIYRVLAGLAKPSMPPTKHPRPNAAEIEKLKAWIDGGAKGPAGAAAR